MKLKTFVTIMTTLATACALQAQSLKEIKLPAPDKNRGSSVMKALSERRSVRECADRQLSTADLSDLLWAANGVNRPAEKMRTAPSALNKQDIDIYVFRADGVYLYDPFSHTLKPVVKGDQRALIAGKPSPARAQDFVKAFPVVLLFVSDLSRFGSDDDRTRLMAAMDAGIVSQNVNLFCAATGLCTVPRASMDMEGIVKLLKLGKQQLPLLNNPVGYPKP